MESKGRGRKGDGRWDLYVAREVEGKRWIRPEINLLLIKNEYGFGFEI